MKCVFYIFFFILLSNTAKADTIDYWHVYYNQAKVKEYNQNGGEDLILKAAKVKKGDVITVKYYTDTPCQDCPVLMTVEDESKQVIVTVEGEGEGIPLSFQTDSLLRSMKAGKRVFQVYYTEVKNLAFSKST